MKWLVWFVGLTRERVVNNPGLVYTDPVQDFAGEAPLRPEHLLPGNVSPDALNIDYRDGLVRKRGGIRRVGTNSASSGAFQALRGGIRVSQQYAGTAYGRSYGRSESVVTLSETLQTYRFSVSPRWGVVNGDVRVFVHETSGGAGTGLWLKNDTGTYKWEARCVHSGGTLTVLGPAVALGSIFSTAFDDVTVSFDTGTGTLSLTVDGATTSDTIGAETYTQPASYIYLGGASGSDRDKEFVLSNIRVWDGTVEAANLAVWWRMLSYALSGSYADLSGNGIGLVEFGNGGAAYGDISEADAWDEVEALALTPTSPYVFAGTRGVWGTLAGAKAVLGRQAVTNSTRDYRMQLLQYRGYTIALNGVGENRADYDVLSIPAPVLSSGLTIAAAGSGGSLSAGVYSYLFALYNSATGVESAVGTQVSTQTAVSNDTLTIDFTTGGWASNGHYSGVDQIRIYRTKAGESVYYHLTDIAINSTSHADTAADSTLVTVRDPYVGYAAPSRFGFEYDGSLWLGNQDGNESRLVWTERNTLGAFYDGNYVDVAPDDGDTLTAGFAQGGRAVVFKRRSIWLIQGAGSTPLKLASGVGCVQQATVSASHDAVFFLGEGGVYALPLPLGSGAPAALTGRAWHDEFSGQLMTDWERCCGCWDAVNGRYLLSYTVNGDRRMLVYTADNRAWAKWDADVTALLVAQEGTGRTRVFCGWRHGVGYLDEDLLRDGVASDVVSAFGTATGGASTTLTDSTASWGSSGWLANVDVTVWDASGGNEQTRTIISHTATELTVDSAWDVTPEAGWTYALGAIEGRWRSPRLGLDVWHREKRLDRVRVLRDAQSGDDVVFGVTVDEESEAVYTLTENTRLEELHVGSGHGREVRVAIRDTSSDKTFALAGLSFGLVQQEGV